MHSPAFVLSVFLITNSLALLSEEASSDFINLVSTAFHSEIGRGPLKYCEKNR